MKILLIDDEAENGWKEVIEKILFKGELIFSISELPTAQEKLSNEEFDLIFLDLRFGENDHHSSDISKYGGYKILTEFIRGTFENKNFSTPVILFTATNKAWNIFEMIECGADDFYIKEHPDTAYDLEFSRKNYERLKKGVPNLIELGKRRRIIWQYIQDIVSQIRSNIQNQNIKKRIEEKLKIGYGLLFGRTTKVESEQLLFNNEVNAFIVFWSILEEISKDSFKDNWVRTDPDDGKMKDNKWILKNGNVFVEDNRIDGDGSIKVGIKRESDKYIAKDRILNNSDKDISFFTGKLNLSVQIYALMLLGKNWDADFAKNKFLPLNDYRNKVDFIHSSVKSIFRNILRSCLS